MDENIANAVQSDSKGDWDSYKDTYNVVSDSSSSVQGDDKKQEDQQKSFHQEQDKLFQQMSKNFALGNDEQANKLREQLKQNIAQEYSRLKSDLEYVPPRLPELKTEIKEELGSLEKSVEDGKKEDFDSFVEQLWKLSKEMQDVKKEMQEKRKATEELIASFKQRYGNLVPQQDS